LLMEYPYRFESYGAVRIHELAKVLEIDSLNHKGHRGVHTLDCEKQAEYASKTAIVIPVKNEDILTLENVISAVPHSSTVILVSASSREPVDRYSYEVDLAQSIYSATQRKIIVLHQQDPAWAHALEGTPLEDMLEEAGEGGEKKVRKGKGEGMLLGVLAASAIGAEYVGFIDSDNYVPGAAHEYAWVYYSGFALTQNPHVMVRIKWPFKGKLASSDLYLRRRGRVSQITNTVLNYALTRIKKVETDIVQTANSGEHALSIDLALKMKWAGGFAVEPYQYVYLLETCYLGLSGGECRLTPDGVAIYQVEPRNPHIHAERGQEHIARMVAISLGTIYHSRLASDEVKERILKILANNYGITQEPPKPRVYDPYGIDPRKTFERFRQESADYRMFGLEVS